MYKVLLIDDEAIIVEGLMKIVPWEKYGCRVIASAEDGLSGAQAIRRYKPDIVFTDIRMPNIDGLSMIAGVKSEFPDMQVTVLTGYRDFTYAQEAIRLGVTRFFVKPSKMDELEEALVAMTAKLDGRKESASLAEPAKEAENDDIASSFIVRQALSYIKQHYSEKITLTDVADKCYVSQWHLSKLLNKHLGQNFYEIINGIRIREAKRLLSNPSLRINEIADQVGYTDTAHFSRVFKKMESMSPNEYRNTTSS